MSDAESDFRALGDVDRQSRADEAGDFSRSEFYGCEVFQIMAPCHAVSDKIYFEALGNFLSPISLGYSLAH